MHQSNFGRRAGLTLIELIVVLAILVALGGIAAATLPDMLNRTHVATVATTLPTVDATIRENILLNSGLIGDRFDGLVTAGGTPASFVNASGAYTAYSLAGNDPAALASLGMTQVVPADDTVANATFLGHQGAPVAIADGTNVCALEATVAARIMGEVWNYTPLPGAQYLVFGLGGQCSLVGANAEAVFAEPPLHSVDAHSERADQSYARVMLVFELTDAGTADAEARFIGVGAPHPDGIQGVATHLQEWYGG